MQNKIQVPTGTVLPGPTLVSDVNDLAMTLATLAAGNSAPTTAGLGVSSLASMLWHDTSNDILCIRDEADANWLTAAQLDEVGKAISFREGYRPVNAQTGTSYAITSADRGRLITLSNASPVAVSCPQSNSANRMGAGWYTTLKNNGAGVVTVTPTTSTIDGLAALKIQTGQSVQIVSDGTNLFTNLQSPPAGRGALARRTTQGTNLFANGVATSAPWESTIRDTDGIWSAGSPTRLTVPTGVVIVRLTWAVRLSVNVTVISQAQLFKNGAVVTGGGAALCPAGQSLFGPAMSADLVVSGGDFFEVSVNQTSGAGAGYNGAFEHSWFAMEILR